MAVKQKPEGYNVWLTGLRAFGTQANICPNLHSYLHKIEQTIEQNAQKFILFLLFEV